MRHALHGEVSKLTWDQPILALPFRVFRSGGLTSGPTSKAGCMPRPEGVITDAHSPPVTVEVDFQNNTNGGLTEVAVFDADDVEVFSNTISLSSTRIPRLTNPITVSYYDCLEGRVAHNGSRNEQYVSDGTVLVYTRLPFSRRAALRARVSAVVGVPTFTVSQSGFFRNPADPIVTITNYWESEDGYIVVQLAVAPAIGRIVTIQDSNYPSGTSESGGSRVRLVPPVVFFTVGSAGARANCPAPESGYGNDGSGHAFGTYKFRWKSGSFFDPNTNQYFVFNLDGTARLVARHLTTQPFTTPDATWTDLAAGLDAAATEAAAQALAAPVEGIVTAPATSQVRMGVALLNPPAGCTGSVELYFESISPGFSV
jgi:hypothetical protein